MAHNPDIANPDITKKPVLTNQVLGPDDTYYPDITKFSRLQATELPV